MRRPSPWLILVVLLLGLLILREPRLQRVDDLFLNWFVQHAESRLPPAPVTLVEIGRDDFQKMLPPEKAPPLKPGVAERRSLSPLEYALFLQAVLEFQPTVVALEPMLIWRDRDQTQEQIFIDQAMRVPKLLVAFELGEKGPRDLALDDLAVFPKVSGNRGQLPQFAGVARQPDDDIRLISTPGFSNQPNEQADPLRVPMLFEYRGEIVPSFPLQAIMLWLRLTPAEVQIQLGSKILLPNGWTIPLHPDGTTTINPIAGQSVRHLTLDQLLLAAQEHEGNRPPSLNVDNLKDQIVLLRLAGDPLQPANYYASAIATIQNHAYVRSSPPALAWGFVLAAVLLSWFLGRIAPSTLLLSAIIFSAGYALLNLSVLSQANLWLPTFLPLALLWFLVVVRLCSPAPALVPPEAREAAS